MKCDCGEELTYDYNHEWRTLVAYHVVEGHDHDDNCITRRYVCPNEHRKTIGIINKCSNKDCGWVGKKKCLCCIKVEAWP